MSIPPTRGTRKAAIHSFHFSFEIVGLDFDKRPRNAHEIAFFDFSLSIDDKQRFLKGGVD